MTKRLKILAKSAWINALLFGILVWMVMNLVVLPLSRMPPLTLSWSGAVEGH
jgi:hypothetical protein